MNRPFQNNEDLTPEAGFCNMAASIQFENGQKHHYVLEKWLMAKTVGEAKNTLLNIGALNVGQVPPGDVAISLMMPGKNVGEAGVELDLDETKKMKDYVDDISCCDLIKLKRRDKPALSAGNLLTG